MIKKTLKLFLPVLFLASYTISSHFIYYGINDNVFRVKDVIQQIAGNLLFILLLFLYAHLVCNKQWKMVKKKKLQFGDALLILLMIPGIQFLIDRIVILWIKQLSASGPSLSPVIRDIGEIRLFLFDALFAILIAPLLEEMLFRFCLISSYHSVTGKIYGMVCATVLFGYMHSTISNRISSLIFGLITGSLFLLTQNIFICILIHAGVNLYITICACISSYLQNKNLISFSLSVIYVNTPILLVTLCFSLFGAVLLFRRWKFRGQASDHA